MGRAGRAQGQGVGFGIYLAWGKAMNTATQRERKPRPPLIGRATVKGARPTMAWAYRSRAKIAGLIR